MGDARWSEAAAFGDYDGDGKLDLYVANWGDENALYRNNGDGIFTDATETAGVGHSGSAKAVYCLDYDADGASDLFVVNSYQQPDVLYRNNGDGTFTDVTQTAGLDDDTWGEAVAFSDYDGDGDIDIYLVASSGGNVLYANNGDGTFSVATKVAGVGNTSEGTAASFGDYDNDGDMDIYVVNKGRANVLYMNSHRGKSGIEMKKGNPRKATSPKTPSINPIQKANFWVSSGFGWRVHPLTRKKEFHQGLDIAARRGTPVVATADGTVVFMGKDTRWGYTVKLQHDERYMTVYAHLKGFSEELQHGTKVTQNQIIGYVGSSGRTIGSNLHYEVWVDGKPQNPKAYIHDAK